MKAAKLCLMASALFVGCDGASNTTSSTPTPQTRDDAVATDSMNSNQPTGTAPITNNNLSDGMPRSGTPTSTNPTNVDRDNTAVNQRDRNNDAKTPFDQSEKQSDLDVTAKIRSRVVSAKMSTYAENVKIMTDNGMVTLRGPVSTQEEKSRIEEIARDVAGDAKVDNQLEVKQNK